jgi:hypothetical protein
MRVLFSVALFVLSGCGASQAQQTANTVPGDPEAAVREVTALIAQRCEAGLHGDLELVSPEGPILVVGTAGETMEGRALLEQTNASYESRGVAVRYDCSGVQRWVYASEAGDVVWAEEAIETHATFPGMQVAFPSQRTLVFERTAGGWRLRYYGLSVRLPDDRLDEVYGLPQGEAGAPAEPAPAPGTGPAATAD